VLSEEHEQSGPLAPAACPRLPCYCGPVRHPLVFRPLPRALVIGRTWLPRFRGGRGGLLQLLSASWSPCCRSHPPSGPSRQPACDGSYGLRPSVAGSASGASHCRGYLCVHFRYGPVTRWPSRRWRCRWAFGLGFPPPDHPSYGASGSSPVGLPPTERASLGWTHNGACGFPALRFPARFAPWVMDLATGSAFGEGHLAPADSTSSNGIGLRRDVDPPARGLAG